MASMECVLHVLLRVMMRRSICRLQEVVDMAVDIGTALVDRRGGTGLRPRLPSAAGVVVDLRRFNYILLLSGGLLLDGHV